MVKSSAKSNLPAMYLFVIQRESASMFAAPKAASQCTDAII
jgi:hypothetical protein